MNLLNNEPLVLIRIKPESGVPDFINYVIPSNYYSPPFPRALKMVDPVFATRIAASC